MVGTGLSGMMKIRKTGTSSICAITASSQKKRKNVSPTTINFVEMSPILGRARRFDDVYILDGRTDRGRRLRLVFQDKGNGLAQVFTGWDLIRKKRRKR